MISRIPNKKTTAFFVSMLMTMLASVVVSAQQKPASGYAPVNGLKMYYEIHGKGDPVVLLHGSFMTITINWTSPWGNGAPNWIAEFSKTRKVIAIEMQGHGRTGDINRDFRYENLAEDVAATRSSHHSKSGPCRLQHGRRRRYAVCDPTSGKSA